MDHRQPIFNVPGVVLALLASFVAVHLLRWALPPEESLRLTEMLAFIPAREVGGAADLPGGNIAVFTSFLTHQFVHGDSTHLIINSAWLLAFGTPVARRTDWLRFLLFFLMTGVAGALLYLAVALWMNNWWAALMLAAVVFVIHRAVIAREERYLTAAFPGAYDEYCARTRRWI